MATNRRRAEDPDFSEATDVYYDAFDAVSRTRAAAKAAGLTKEEIDLLYPLPLQKTFSDSARASAAKARKRMDEAIRKYGHEDKRTVKAAEKAEEAEKNYDLTSRAETKAKVRIEIRTGRKDSGSGGSKELKDLRDQESKAYEHLGHAQKTGEPESVIQSLKAKANSLSRKRREVQEREKKALVSASEAYRRASDGE